MEVKFIYPLRILLPRFSVFAIEFRPIFVLVKRFAVDVSCPSTP
jgi:hypothetical protein